MATKKQPVQPECHSKSQQKRIAALTARYRFRDAITGLFVRAADALKRTATTVRERVK